MPPHSHGIRLRASQRSGFQVNGEHDASEAPRSARAPPGPALASASETEGEGA